MKKEIKQLKRYFTDRSDVLAAFLFGSQAKNIAGKISDWDIAIYFKPEELIQVDWEETDKDLYLLLSKRGFTRIKCKWTRIKVKEDEATVEINEHNKLI